MALMTPLNFDANNKGVDTVPRDGSFHIYLCTQFLKKTSLFMKMVHK